jgi:hypothetical protein
VPRVEPGEAIPSGWQLNQRGQLEPAGTAEGHNPNMAPFSGVRPLSDDQAINPAGIDRDPTGKLLREVQTDTGIKALGVADLQQSTSRPAPPAARQIASPSPAAAASRNANARYRPRSKR